MKIEELILDGFKSYAVRTVISGWDSSFNAITGLNGSGKSNILDAICFVLGITNMSTVRAQNLQDLIYKRGQAGVTKASVTIVFDNRNTKSSPIGFEEYAQISVTRQIVMGGTSKYLINGHRAQQQTVQNLFQSVQLNINNPNFLIMQGRITKVLNMKATEILAMIEEAAGTRMFEERKDKAFKTMSKKDLKVKEIEELLRDEIEPKLEKLRGEKRAFLEFQQTRSDLERMTKVVVAHDYTKYQERLSRSGADLEAKKRRIDDLEANAKRAKTEIANIEEDIEQLKSKREKELRKGGRFQKLENEVKETSHEVVRLNAQIELKNGSVTEDKKQLVESQNMVAEVERALREKQASFTAMSASYEKMKSEYDAQQQEALKKEELLQTLSTGVAAREGQDNGYMDQLQDARNRASQAATEQEQAKLKIAHFQERIGKDEPRAKKAREQNKGLSKNLEQLRAQAQQLEAQLGSMGFQEGREAEMMKARTQLQNQVRELTEKSDVLKRKVANIDFTYSNPTPNFDRRQVKGLVAQLFTLDEKNFNKSTALEICAGGRLYNVVVDNEVVGTQLLQKGKLRKRVTIIPLNKISAFRASAEKIAAAHKIAPNKVDLALSLVGYDEEVSKAMEYVFGSTLICADAETAKRVTFDPNVRLKSVTLDGDVYDPSGTLSGGSSPNSSGVLVQLQKLNEITRELDAARARLDELNRVMAQEQQMMQQAKKLKQALDLKKHEATLMEGQITSNSDSRIINEIENMKQEVETLSTLITEAKARESQAKKDAKAIEKEMEEFNNNKDSKLAELQKTVDELKEKVAKQSATVKAQQKEYQTLQLETEQLGGDLEAAQEAFKDAAAGVEAQEAEVSELRKAHAAVKDKHDLLSAELEDEKAKLTGFNEELASLEQAAKSKNQQIADEALEVKTLKHDVEQFHKVVQDAQQSLTKLEKEHDWIDDEKEHFNKPGTPYHFSAYNISECKAQHKVLSERYQGMKKKVNAKVMNMIDSVEKKEAALKNNIRTIIRDKRKIEETIASLDEYKKEALDKTWTKVSVDFGNIFGELLPGNTAKLEPPEGKDVTEGLEVKVCLGKVWKQSLTELSGGQRSLIALSLIMSLLQFKPAPMYILDEVDAALDLSHTQNIGRLIKTRFKGAQFVVVSLKEGMFSNANRLFRTRFLDGTSVVQASSGA
ncbi:hypothetical protein G7K_1538-t1 [Saitoella complicata NRRL Y-17804]|uniref:Structural maintenance of chromosomes protein n=2 Tax=Saitoella complicata (strain BCRC 22490 / CBS 7301 / JCM 7358 / NBRC 10748 / NRRL Y-17804) TaxID=698492 RepID=A0A0E9ND43_SAICN|nr:hypothetical protein G7K_1538-t1 [Saitoella complicata NRRL Y-17804]